MVFGKPARFSSVRTMALFPLCVFQPFQNRRGKNYLCNRATLFMDKLITIIKAIFLTGTTLILAGTTATAQQEAGPFDILSRLPRTSPADSAIIITASSNPFDITRISAGGRLHNQASPQFQVYQRKKPISAKEKTALYRRFLFATIMAMLVILTLVLTIFRIFIAKIWKAFLNDNILSQLLREREAGATIGYLILYLIFFINAGIFTFLALKYYHVKLPPSHLQALLLCIGGITLFYAAKHALLAIVRYVFPVEKEVARYNFTVMVFNIVTGIFLAPMILFAAYSSEPVNGLIIQLTIGLFAGVLAFRALRGLFIANRLFAWHKFHFFLYLCAVELAPLLVTFKLLDVW